MILTAHCEKTGIKIRLFLCFGNFLRHQSRKNYVLLNIDDSSSRYLLWRFWIVDGKGKIVICLCPDYTKKSNNKKGEENGIQKI